MTIFTGTQSLMIAVVGVGFGILIGVLLHAWWSRRVTRLKRRIPKYWPLVPRAITNSQERLAWLWISRTFFDHSVMIKMPVSRFTLPKTREQGQHWYQLLSNAYCTFTVVDAFGHVVGCVDVNSPMRNLKRSQNLKRSLLDQCGIAYVILETSKLPDTAKIRSEFLGEQILQHRANHLKSVHEMNMASDHLRASLERQRQTRQSDLAPLSSHIADQSDFSSDAHVSDSHILRNWQGNSFISPLDSRRAGLD